MKNVYELCLSSSHELKKVKNLVLASLLMTINILLDLFTLQILPTLHVSFEFLASAATGMFFGPVVGAICGGLGDVIKYILNPKVVFFPGFTISAIVGGIIYGLILYKKEVTVLRCILTEVLITIIVSVCLNTYWLSILYEKAFLFLFWQRIAKSVIMLPINITLMYVVLRYIGKIKKKYFDM